MQRAYKEDGGFTLKDYLTWPDDERWELIDGVAYALSAPSLAHQELVSSIIAELRIYLKGKTCRAFVSPVDVVFSDADDTDVVVQPDVLVVCDAKKTQGLRIVGAPDIVVEVLSPSTALIDSAKKLDLYQRHGVKEYWIVSPEERAISQRSLLDGQYGDAVMYYDGMLRTPILEGFELNVQELFANMDAPPE